MGYLCLTRRDGENIRFSIDPGVDLAKLLHLHLHLLLRYGITIRIDPGPRRGARGHRSR